MTKLFKAFFFFLENHHHRLRSPLPQLHPGNKELGFSHTCCWRRRRRWWWQLLLCWGSESWRSVNRNLWGETIKALPVLFKAGPTIFLLPPNPLNSSLILVEILPVSFKPSLGPWRGQWHFYYWQLSSLSWGQRMMMVTLPKQPRGVSVNWHVLF